MVKPEACVYLFLGDDPSAKDAALEKIKQQAFDPATREFNLDTLYAAELTLHSLQERLLFLPLKQNKRMVIVRNCQQLKEETRDFLAGYVKNPAAGLILVLDLDRPKPKDGFVAEVSGFARVIHFKEERRSNTFDLSDSLEARNAKLSLEILHRLLANGEEPLRILGGLRASWEKRITDLPELKRRIRLLLQCDLEIKTGRFKSPVFVLERLVVRLCGFRNPAR
jgi:DNA polymerase III delta subunit